MHHVMVLIKKCLNKLLCMLMLVNFSPPFVIISLFFILQDQFLVEYGRKLDEFRNMLSNSINVEGQGKNSLAGLKLVDAVLRLGIEYHFKGEIEAILKREHVIFNNGINCGNNYVDQDLLEVALRFRLLRQGGYDVSAGIHVSIYIYMPINLVY